MSTSETQNPNRFRSRVPVLIAVGAVVVIVLMLAFGRTQRRDPGLTEFQARYLQDVEHFGGFVFGDRCLPQWAEAIGTSDRATLLSLLTEDCVGRLVSEDAAAETSVHGHVTSVERTGSAESVSTSVSRDAVADWWVRARQGFQSLAGVKAKIKRMQPSVPYELGGNWEGTMLVLMTGRSREDRIREMRIAVSFQVPALDDETPDQEAWFSRFDITRVSTVESDAALMTEMTDATRIDVSRLQDNWSGVSGPQTPALTGGVYLADYDSDGLVDCLLTDLNGLGLYRGMGEGRFVEMTDDVGLPREFAELPAAWGDFDNDGDPDLVLGRRFYRNDCGSGTAGFTRLATTDTDLDIEDAVGYAVADVDSDGLLDLYVVGIGQRTSGQKWIGANDTNRNQLWHNEGGLTFRDITESSGTKGRGTSTFAAVFFDANNDGHLDLMTACEFGLNDFWLGTGDGRFEAAKLPEVYGGFSMGLTVGDIDNDGLADPYVANMYSKAGERVVANLPRDIYDEDVDSQLRDFVSGSDLYHNVGGGRFERMGQSAGVADVGWAYGPAYVDLDNDGLLDLYAPCGFQSVTRKRPDG